MCVPSCACARLERDECARKARAVRRGELRRNALLRPQQAVRAALCARARQPAAATATANAERRVGAPGRDVHRAEPALVGARRLQRVCRHAAGRRRAGAGARGGRRGGAPGRLLRPAALWPPARRAGARAARRGRARRRRGGAALAAQRAADRAHVCARHRRERALAQQLL